MIFEKGQEVPEFCLFHGIPKDLVEFEFWGTKFEYWRCSLCDKELEETNQVLEKQGKKEITEIKMKKKVVRIVTYAVD